VGPAEIDHPSPDPHDGEVLRLVDAVGGLAAHAFLSEVCTAVHTSVRSRAEHRARVGAASAWALGRCEKSG
jgi:hypothetical protein